MTIQELRATVDRLPRKRFAHLPTPLEELPRLSKSLGGPRILIKRDDCTGLAFGGNKTRHFEFSIGDALASGYDSIVTGAASQSNHCRQAAAMCAKFGVPCHLVLRNDSKRFPLQGNLLLMHLFGAHVRFVDCELGPELDAQKEALADELRSKGLNPYILSSERGNAPNTIGYVNMVLELEEQLAERDIQPSWLYLCSAGATGAGTLLGARLLNVSWKPVSISPILWPFSTEERMAALANGAAKFLGVDCPISACDIDVRLDYVGPAYGVLTPQAKEAMDLMARTEGITVDPVYTAKCLAGLIDHIRQVKITKDDTVVFVHTGGTPALFAYAQELSVK